MFFQIRFGVRKAETWNEGEEIRSTRTIPRRNLALYAVELGLKKQVSIMM